MPFPQPLQDAVEELVWRVESRDLERAAVSLSERYRAGAAEASRVVRSRAEVAAYLATRAPATYAAAADVFRRIRYGRPGWQPRSLLDLGAGPGVAAWAALETWPSLDRITLVETEGAMVEAGRAVAEHGEAALRDAHWVQADVRNAGGAADLVVASYLLGELEPEALAPFVDRVWEGAVDTFVVIEPGTTKGYERVIFARDRLVDSGGHVLAPCPHDRMCPLPRGDWCHFSVRLARSRLHRATKGAELGFEDEKMSYAVVCREWHPRHDARVIRRPQLHDGHVALDLCTTAGLEQRTLSRRHGAAYKEARRAAWGDALESRR